MLGYERPLAWAWSSGDGGGWEKPSLSASGQRDCSGRRTGGRPQEGLPLREK